MDKQKLIDWAVRNGYKQSTRSSKIFKKVFRKRVCTDGIEREIYHRLVFNDKALRIEQNYYCVLNYYGKKIVETHWMRLASGFYGQLSINPENDKIRGLR